MRQFLLALAFLVPAAGADLRTWTNTDGRAIRAELLAIEDGNALFEFEGKRSSVPLLKLSELDRTYIKDEWIPPFDYGNFRRGGKPWPAAVDLLPGATEVEVITAEPEKRNFVYRTKNFEFTSDAELAGSTMEHVSETFEATYLLLQSLPWSVPSRAQDDPLFPASLFEHFSDYVKSGGPPNSGGVYKRQENRFYVPFKSLGLQKKNGRYFRADRFDVDVLVHEVTHMMMAKQLAYLPIWVIEGSAEFTSSMPYSAGRFRCDDTDKGLRDYLEKYGRGRGGGAFSGQDLRGVLEMSREEWGARTQTSPSEQHRLYAAAFVLFYYFEHLDDRSKGYAMHEFFHRAEGEGRRWEPYWADMKNYRGEIDKFKKHPEVESTKNGGFRYPSNLTPPARPKPPEPGGYTDAVCYLHIDLLFRGRTEREILADLVKKMDKRLRIKL